jgi:DNA topoisomerase I
MPATPSLEAHRLKYVCDTIPGIRRVSVRSGFRYVGLSGKELRDRDVLARITALAIPPAWAEVWICPDPNGHIQATGRDAKGRKQYRYHTRWRESRDGTKYHQLAAFGLALPRVRERVQADLKVPGLPREKVLAAVVRLMDLTHLRVGNAEYARSNKSFGLSTLLDRHAAFDGPTLRLKFRGKSGVWHDRAVTDPRLARIVRACRDLPGEDLFQYLDDSGEPRAIGSADVNGYIRDAAGDVFTAKVFRTWAGTVSAATLLAVRDAPAAAIAGRKTVAEVVRDRGGRTREHPGRLPGELRPPAGDRNVPRRSTRSRPYRPSAPRPVDGRDGRAAVPGRPFAGRPPASVPAVSSGSARKSVKNPGAVSSNYWWDFPRVLRFG